VRCAQTQYEIFRLKYFLILLRLLIFFFLLWFLSSLFSRDKIRYITRDCEDNHQWIGTKSSWLTFPETYIWNERTNQCNRGRNGFKLEFQHSFLLVLVWILRVLSGMRNIARNFVIQWKNESDSKRRIRITLLCNI